MSSLRFVLKSTLACTVFGLLALPAVTHAEDRLQPRAEVGVKAGSERSVLTTEFWAPLAQRSDRVIYADVRLMGDNDENREGNLGFGYRQINEKTNSVIGFHGWIDRRRTEYNNTFHAVTFGIESLGSSIDLRANGYIALGGSETAITPNTGSTTPYLAGTGLFYNTNGSVTETPQHGFDAEAGYRLPVLERHVDTVRVFGGGYHFFRSNTDNVTGIRIRTEAQINPALSLGARFQHDGPRGSQGFLEATLKFPFSAKKMFQKSGLHARLDESPERDIDIVTGAKVDNGQRQITNSTTGAAQRIIYVDNTNTNTGDGSYENPFNTLKAAEAALKANDILYVRSGNGTTTGMDQGITITQSGVSLVGSGSNLTVGGITFLNAGAAPTITNTQTYIDDFTGNGIFVRASDVSVSGLTINGAKGYGVAFYADTGQVFEHATLNNVTITNGARYGGVMVGIRGGTINNVDVSNLTTNNNANFGLLVQGYINGTIGTANINNIISSNNGFSGVSIGANGGNSKIQHAFANNIVSTNNNGAGILVDVGASSTINNILIENSTTNGNSGGDGINVRVSETGGLIDNAIIRNNVTNNNRDDGVRVSTTAVGTINNAVIDQIVASGNKSNGVDINMNFGTINTVTISNITVSNATSNGIGAYIRRGTLGTLNLQNVVSTNNSNGLYLSPDTSNGRIGQINGNNITATGNASVGLQILASALGSTIDQVNLSNITTMNNGANGIELSAYGATIGSASLTGITTANNSNNGIYIFANSRSTIGQFNLDSATAYRNGTSGIQAFASGIDAVIGQANISNVTSNNNFQNGIQIRSNVNGLVSQANITNSIASSNRVNGIYAGSDNAGTIGNVLMSNNTANNNVSWGVLALADGAGSRINTATVNSNSAAYNNSSGIRTVATNSGLIGNLSVTGNTSSGNTVHGYVVAATVGGTITNSVFQNNTATNNATIGILFGSQGSASNIASSVISGNTSTGNAQYGFQLLNDTTSSFSTSFYNNTLTGNTLNGLFISRAGTGTLVFDAGGGSLGSIGGNKILNNTGTEVRVDGGYALQAQNNYWGGGDLAGGERTLNGGSTITTTGFLVTDPRP